MPSMLVLAPHIDDETLGCGGTIAKYSECGCRVTVVAFSSAWNSLLNGYDDDSTEKEFRKAVGRLGCEGHIMDYQTRTFGIVRQNILDSLLYWKEQLIPEIVIAPSSYDIHQDHRVIHEEACRAFYDTTLWGFESIKKCKQFKADVYVKLSSRHLTKKIRAAKCYKSQMAKDWFPGVAEIISSHAKVRGLQIDAPRAEAFQCIHTVVQ